MLDKSKSSKTKLVTPDAPTVLAISPPNFQSAKVKLIGTAPLVLNKMSSDNRRKMMEAQMKGSQTRKGAKREPKDFDAVYRGALHIAEEGWYGFPASALRTAMVDACRLVGFKMTVAKLSVFVEAQGLDCDDGQPLVKIIGEPVRKDMAVKLATGVTDILSRPFFHPWSAEPTLTWDADQFSAGDAINLLSRVGLQVGIGAGRPNSKNSCGMGWGCFKVEG
jgi:hypothetical protein